MSEEGKNICFRDMYGFREKISVLVDRGEYNDMTDFIVKAIKEKLEPGSSRIISRRDILELMRTDPEVQEELRRILSAALAEKLRE